MNAPLTDEGPPRDAIRARLRGMSDAHLEAHGKALQYMTSPQASYQEIRATYQVQLQEARAEWRRRKAKAGRALPRRSTRSPQDA